MVTVGFSPSSLPHLTGNGVNGASAGISAADFVWVSTAVTVR